MKTFIIQHIDAIITTALGLGLSIYAWHQRERLRASPQKIVRALPILALLVLAFGLLRFTFESRVTYEWHRVYSADHHASAEFPRPTDAETSTDTARGVSLQNLTIQCDIPYRSINLRLSYNGIPPEGAGLTVEQRIEGMRSYFEQQGFTVASCVPEESADIPHYRIVINKGEKTRVFLRVAITSKAIYRAMATSTDGYHDDAVITRFLDSFVIH